MKPFTMKSPPMQLNDKKVYKRQLVGYVWSRTRQNFLQYFQITLTIGTYLHKVIYISKKFYWFLTSTVFIKARTKSKTVVVID